MRILVVSTHDSRGGAGKAAYRFSKEFINQGHNVCLYVRDKSEKDSFIIASKTKKFFGKFLHLLDFLPGYILSGFNKNAPFTLGLFGESLETIIREFKPDIINIHWTWKGFVSFAEICRISRKIPVVWTMHDYSPLSDGVFHPTKEITKLLNGLKSFNGSIRKVLLRNANITFVSPSKFLLADYQKSWVAINKRGVLINNGVDLGIFNDCDRDKVKKELGLNPKKRYIGFGAVNWTDDIVKGGDLLTETIAQVGDALVVKDIGLLAFGSQDPFKRIECNKDLEKHFLGFIKGDKNMSQFLSACDLFLVFSRFENYPFVVMEPQCCGTPVLAFSIGGIPEMVDRRYLIQPFDTKAFAETILNELNSKDKSLRKEAFDIKGRGGEYLKLFGELL